MKVKYVVVSNLASYQLLAWLSVDERGDVMDVSNKSAWYTGDCTL